MRLDVIPERLSVCRLPPGTEVPAWAPRGFGSLTWTPDEVSIVCASADAPPDAQCEPDWRALRVAGPLPFAQTGVLASLAAPLAAAGVSIFAISTYDTDYILVKADRLADAVAALTAEGHHVTG